MAELLIRRGIEVLTRLAFYAGWPNSMTTMSQLKAILENADHSG
ncbi:hypothetical protein SSP24_29830 [Streptomyces spinoverrucosus]|uniref:Uncharacterized protein n=1 Tax=Streptomyces spinoverrucosus TaxID=284043 RepID=A0A4Y3VGU0_9ACTN|nr:hypothetical protein [Streptomyces spinoverrucosus]GEC05328.1 hypothetical protein SSP24_29830 [Streptomyces spinoverrucosus]GHB79090.1 hypothetical protein GCM10010397_57220 [Streptomyces spinoverrucosus]